ncbi:MAG: (d)CMP kinase [Actinomycetota bacterium]|nr:(d)CMP kinase [Actinomycetota bacterium]
MELIAIDGLAGTGKSTLAKSLAARLGLNYLDTGATFRMMAWAALSSKANLESEAEVMNATDFAQIAFEDGRCFVNGTEVTDEIRTDAVSSAASKIAVFPQLRERLLLWQRRWVADHGDSVVEGRDMTSVVFPDAPVKIFLAADPQVRAIRRSEATADRITERDKRDSERAVAPLQKVPGAVEIDTTSLTVEEVEGLVVDLWEKHKASRQGIG